MDGQQAVTLKGGAARPGVRRDVRGAYEETFVEAYERYYTKVFAYIYSRVDNVELAKDLTAEVFEKAYVKGHNLREYAAYTSWLFMIAKNVVIGHYRRHKREIGGINRLKESLWVTERPSDPEDNAVQSEAVTNLTKHLRELSERDQELLSLKFEGELSYPEIGRVLRMSEVNARVSVFRALKRLRILMESDVR